MKTKNLQKTFLFYATHARNAYSVTRVRKLFALIIQLFSTSKCCYSAKRLQQVMKVLQNDSILILLWSNISVFPHQKIDLFHMKSHKKPTKIQPWIIFEEWSQTCKDFCHKQKMSTILKLIRCVWCILWQSGLNRKLESELRDYIRDCSAKLCAALFRWRIGLGAAVSLESAHFWLDDQANLTASQTYHCNIVTNVTPSPLKAKTMLTRYKLVNIKLLLLLQ